MASVPTDWVPLKTVVPKPIMLHILHRMTERGLTKSDAQLVLAWVRTSPMVPPGDWYKRFPNFILVGDGQYPKSVLSAHMKPWGTSLTSSLLQTKPQQTAPTPVLAGMEKKARTKYGTVQAELPEDSDAHEAITDVRVEIDPSDLDGKGLRIGPTHITVRYGIKSENTASIEAFLSMQPPMEAQLAATSFFPPSESSDNAAVIIAPVVCFGLFEINERLGDLGNRTDGRYFTEPDFEYTPHCTIAYVKAEAAEKYVGIEATAGQTFTIREVVVVTPSNERKIITLNGVTQDGVKTAAHRVGDLFALAMTETLPLNPQKFEFHNERYSSQLKPLIQALKAGEELPPILVVQKKNGKYHVLDGNHRLQAALNAKKTEIEAYVVTWPDLKKVLDAYFDGQLPLEASELDDYILLDDDNMEVYSKRADGPTQDQDQMGKPGDITETPQFKSWFAGSKVVDDHGRPLRVFHGIFGDFDTFHVEQTKEGGAFFTENPEVASLYASGWVGKDSKDGNPKVMPVYLSIKNPKTLRGQEVMDEDFSYDAEVMRKAIETAKKEGHDGLRLLKMPEDTLEDNQWVVFTSNQVKSAIANGGEFDADSHSITAAHQRQEGISPELVKQLYAATSPKRIGTVDDYLVDPKLRSQFAAILDVPVWAFPGLAKNKGALGQCVNLGRNHIYIQLDGGADNQIFFHEMVHADRAAKGRPFLKSDRDKHEDSAEKGQQYYAEREGREFEKPVRREAKMPEITRDAEWATHALSKVRKSIEAELTEGPLNDYGLEYIIEQSFNGLVKVVFQGDPLPKDKNSFPEDYITGASYDAGDSRLPIEVYMLPGSAAEIGNTVQRKAEDVWKRFVGRFVAIYVHEETHRLQFNRMRTRKRKEDPTGKAYQQHLDKFQEGYGTKDPAAYYGHQVEIAAFAREAIQELRDAGNDDRSIYVLIQNSGLWSIASRQSDAFRRYKQLLVHDKAQGPVIFRKFIQNMVRALPPEAHKPISREDYELYEQFKPSTFKQKAKLLVSV